MLIRKLLITSITACGLGLATACRDNDCEIRDRRVYYEPAPPPVVYQSAPVVYQSPPVVYRPRPLVRVRNRFVDVRVNRRGWHDRGVNVNVRRNWD